MKTEKKSLIYIFLIQTMNAMHMVVVWLSLFYCCCFLYYFAVELGQVCLVSSRLATVLYFSFRFPNSSCTYSPGVLSWQGALISLFIIELVANEFASMVQRAHFLVGGMHVSNNVVDILSCRCHRNNTTTRLSSAIMPQQRQHCLSSTSSCIHLPFCLPAMY